VESHLFRDYNFVYPDRANGRSNFIGIWDVDPDIVFEFPSDLAQHRQFIADSEKRLLAVPYFATPPVDILRLLRTYSRTYCRPFRKVEQDALTSLLGGMWTVPPDWRLDFRFQHHMLRKNGDTDILESVEEFVKQTLRLYELGGSFEIVDIGENNCCQKYDIKSPITAALAEEFLVKFSPKVLETTEAYLPTIDGIPRKSMSGLKWKRLM